MAIPSHSEAGVRGAPDNLIDNPLDQPKHEKHGVDQQRSSMPQDEDEDDDNGNLITNPLDKPGARDNLIKNPLDKQ